MRSVDKFEVEIMRMGVDCKFPVRFGDFSIMMRPLSSAEMVECHSKVAAHMETLPKSHRNDIAENTFRAREFLKQASSPYGQYLPQILDGHLDRMTNKQIMAIYKEWLSIEERVNPDIEEITEERLKDLVDMVKKNPKEDWVSQLTELSFGQLVRVAHYSLTHAE